MDTESRDLLDDTYSSTTSTDSQDLNKVLIGALAGAAAGSLLVGLFTEKGIETRKRLGEGSKNMAKSVKEKVSDLKDGIADKYEATKEGAANLIEKGKQKVRRSSANTTYRDRVEDDEDDSGSMALLGVLAAAAAGTIIWGFATEKGNETRKRLSKGSKDMANNLKQKVSNIADGISDKYEAAKEGAADLVERTKQQNNLSSGNTAYKGSASADSWES